MTRILSLTGCALLLSILFSGCGDTPPVSERLPGKILTKRLVGETMGTTYSVVYLPNEGNRLANEVAMSTAIDSMLIALNEEVSNWEKESTVVLFNQSSVGIEVSKAPHFLANYQLAADVHERTAGAFEPTILPLTDYWGFGSGRERIEAGVDTSEVMRRKGLVGMDKIELLGDTFLRKQAPAVQLDLGGSAKGYGTDLIAKLLRNRFELVNFLVEIGGEMYAAGRKGPDRPWGVGINVPREEAAFTAIAQTMPLEDRAVATSGNYRNFYKVDGVTYSHTLNPVSGFPERNSLLSASVTAPDCATADAFATACMVLGPDKALELVEEEPELEAYFLIRDEAGKMVPVVSSGLKPLFE